MKKITKITCALLSGILLSSPCLAFTSHDLDVNMVQVPLTTQLKKYYNGYEYTLTNVSSESLNIANAQILNGNDGGIAYTSTMNNEPSAMARTWAIAGPIGLFTLGIGWILGGIASPFVAVASSNNKKKTQTESLAYTNIIPLGSINAGESRTVSTLVPIGSKPQLKITIHENKTNKLQTVTY